MGIINTIKARTFLPKEVSININGTFAASGIGDLGATQAKKLELFKFRQTPVIAAEFQIKNIQFVTAAGTLGINPYVEVSRPLTGANVRSAWSRRFLYTGTAAALGTGATERLVASQLDHLVTGTAIPTAGDFFGVTHLNPIINGTPTVAQYLTANPAIPNPNAPFTRSFPFMGFGIDLYGTALGSANITIDAVLKVFYYSQNSGDTCMNETYGYGNEVAYGGGVIKDTTNGEWDIAVLSGISVGAASVSPAV